MSDHKIILNEHQNLDALLRDLRIICTWDASLIRQHNVRSKLAMDVRLLKDSLRRHFATEESGSYLQEITTRKPAAGAELLQLHKQHVPFLHQLTEIEIGCREHQRDADPAEDLTEKIRSFLESLSAHEKEETRLLHEVFADSL